MENRYLYSNWNLTKMVVECVCVFPGLATDNDKSEEVLSELENFWKWFACGQG